MESARTVRVCGIGASAGGIEALNTFFETLPVDLDLAYVVVVHLTPDRKSELPTILARRTSMPVVQVGDHEQTTLEVNHVYVIAPDRKLVITGTSVGAEPFEQPRGHRMAIDLMFRSLADALGDGFAVVFSGTGSDGAVGAKAVKERGGLVLVQDPNDAAYPEMPRAAIATGVADEVLPVKDLAVRLAALARMTPKILPLREPIQADEERALRGVFDLLKKSTGHDFSKYKRNAVLRRVSRRMQLSGQLTIAQYLGYLRSHAREVESLFGDFLISVTSFFRDPEAWSELQAQVVGPLLENSTDEIRVWVAGCATGEEAYSVAILFAEEAERRGIAMNHLLIFATDVDEKALAAAREALYPPAISADVSEARLKRFFHREGDRLRVESALRDRVVFAAHDVLRDPPFSRLDLIACRNLLIYLDRELQERVMGVFRYALREQGHLFLGATESADEELFQVVDAKQRIFAPRGIVEGKRRVLPDLLAAGVLRGARYGREPPPLARSSALELHLAALEQAAPPSVLTDNRGSVLHVSPAAGRFFLQSGGPPARLITDLVRPELRDEVHSLIARAAEHPEPLLSTFTAVKFNGTSRQTAVLVQRIQAEQPAAAKQPAQDNFLVTFLDCGALPGEGTPQPEPTSALVKDLREKLRHGEQRMANMRDEHLAVNEDLRAANEELQSLNEEYRSTTEELETSKEELQSVNEELQTVNNELKLKLEEASRTNNDLENLMAATGVATLFLDRELRIKRFTPKLGEIFNIKIRDHERPIGDLTHALDYALLEQDARRVLTDPTPITREAHDRDGRTYVARLSPYRILGTGEMAGVVVTFFDVTSIKAAEAALQASEVRVVAELETLRCLTRMIYQVATASTGQEELDYILAGAIELQHADYGNVQLLDSSSKQLHIVAHRGFGAPFLERFRIVSADDPTACGRALRTRAVSQIPDVMTDPAFAPYRDVAAKAGYRAVQSAPLISHRDTMLGVLSVHFREPHLFTERDAQIGLLLGQQAADLIERRMRQDQQAPLKHEAGRSTAELE